MTKAKCELNTEGASSVPRTCPVCKLGKCTKKFDAKSTDVLTLIEAMADFRARVITKAIDEHEDAIVAMWRTMTVPEFLKRYKQHIEKELGE